MSNNLELPSKEKLKQLSLRAVVAYAARCAQRVKRLYHSDAEHVEAVEQAILVAEDFAKGKSSAVDDAHADGAAAANAVAAAYYAARTTDYAAAARDDDAAHAAARDSAKLTSEARADFQRLLALTKSPAPGDPIDFDKLDKGEPEGSAKQSESD